MWVNQENSQEMSLQKVSKDKKEKNKLVDWFPQYCLMWCVFFIDMLQEILK